MQKKTLCKTFLVLLTIIGLSPKVIGAPFQLSYGGRLTDANGQSVQGSVSLELKFFRALSGGNPLIEAQKFDSVPLEDGVFQVALKALSASQADTLFAAGSDVFIEVRDLTNGITLPRQQFTAVPYALQAQRVPVDANTLSYGTDGKLRIKGPTNASAAMVLGSDSSGNIAWTQAAASQSTPTTLADGSVTTAAIAPNAINTSKISPGAIDSTKLASGSVGSGVLAVGAVQLQHFSAMCLPGEVLKRGTNDWFCSADNTGAGGTDLSGLGDGIVQKSGGVFSELAIGQGLAINSTEMYVDFGPAGTQAVAGNDPRLNDSRAPSGAASGDLLGNYPNPTVKWGAPGDIGVTTPGSAKFTNLDALIDFRLKDNDGTNHYVKLSAPTNLGADANYVLPGAPLAGKVLTTDGGGAMSWSMLPVAAITDQSIPHIKLAVCSSNGQILKWNSGAWTCAADADADSGGDITSVTAGTGLTGGGTTGDPTLSLAVGGVGTGNLADDAVTTDKIASGAVGSTDLADLAVTTGKLADDTVTAAKLADGAVGLAHLQQNMCTGSQILKMNAGGTAWECAADVDTNSGGDITAVTTGAGLTASETSGVVTININALGIRGNTFRCGNLRRAAYPS